MVIQSERQIWFFYLDAKKPQTVGMIVHFCLTSFFCSTAKVYMPSLSVAMESTVALHLSVHFSMKSISENASKHTLVPSDSALLCSPEPPGNYLPFFFFFLVTSVFSFELKFSVSHLKWAIVAYV